MVSGGVLAGVSTAVMVAALATVKWPRLVTALSWSLLAGLLSCVLLFRLFGSDAYGSAIWIWMAIPTVWVALQFWVYWTNRPYVVAGIQAFVSLGAGIALAMTAGH